MANTQTLTGIIDHDLVKSLRIGKIAILCAFLGIGLFAITSFVGAPFILAQIALAAFCGSTVFLTGIIYGILNDLLAGHKNLPYFILGELLSILVYDQNIIRRPSCLIVHQPALRLQT